MEFSKFILNLMYKKWIKIDKKLLKNQTDIQML